MKLAMCGLLKKWMATAVSVVMLLGVGVPVFAAPVYSLRVEDGKVLFQSDGNTVASYAVKTPSLTITADTSGNLLACFFNAKGTYSRIRFKSQSTLSISGDLNSLTLSQPLGEERLVTIASDADVTTANINCGGNLAIAGKVGTLNVGGNCTVTLSKGAEVASALLTASGAKLTAPSGTAVTLVETFNGASASGAGIGEATSDGGSSSSSGSGSQGNGVIELSVSTIYAEEGDRLSDLLSDLENSVRAYTVRDDDEIYGSIKWASSSSTVVNRTSTYSFTFMPDDSRYDTLRGTVRVAVGSSGSDSEVTLKISSLTVSSGKRLRDLTETLEKNVRAYNSYNERIGGMFSWDDADTTRVSEKGTYHFTFTPTSTLYNEVSDSITINVSSSSSSSNDNTTTDRYGQTIETIPIEAESGSTLGNLSGQLKSNVTVLDKNGEKIDGTVKWVANTSVKIRDGKFYSFNFTPSSTKNRSMRSEIQILLGSGSGSSGSSSVITGPRLEVSDSIKTDYTGRRLYDFTSETESLITAYDSRGNEISGVVEWVIDDTTRVEKTGIYKFRFLPDRSSDELRGQVQIIVQGSELDLKVTNLQSVSGRKLRDLTSQLQNNVKAYNSEERLVTGTVSWNESDSNTVSKTGTYTFLFTPRDTSYEPIDGEVKITIGSDASGGNTATMQMVADDIHISSSQYLNDLTETLNGNVTLYNEDGSRIRGTATWQDRGDPRVTRTTSFTFIYTPDDAQYSPVLGQITISVGSKRSGSSLSLKTTPFDADYGARLSELTSDLENAVIAYNPDGGVVSGRAKWVTSTSTKIRDTAQYRYTFTPDSSRYRTTDGWITIISNG